MPSPALVIASVALFVTMGITGYADSQAGRGDGDHATPAKKPKVKHARRRSRGLGWRESSEADQP
jgi:hypothetical protein